MQKLKDITIYASHNGENLKFSTPVTVTKEGLMKDKYKNLTHCVYQDGKHPSL